MGVDTTEIFWPVYKVQFKISFCLIVVWSLLQFIQMSGLDNILNNDGDAIVILLVFTLMYILFPLGVISCVTLLTAFISIKLMSFEVESKASWISTGVTFALFYYGISYFLFGLVLSKQEPAFIHHAIYDYIYALLLGGLGGFYFYKRKRTISENK